MRARTRTLVASAALAALFLGCATPKPNPFHVPVADFDQKVHKVAVLPIQLPADIEKPDMAVALVDQLITDKLKTLDYDIVPSDQIKPITERMKKEMGGVFDPNTGRPDKKKIEAIDRLLKQEIAAKFHPDAIVTPSLVAVTVPFQGGWARWHDVQRSVVAGSGAGEFFAGTYGAAGQIAALSLVLSVYDMNETLLYQQAGGLELLAHVTGRNFVPVPPDQLLTNTVFIAEAIGVATTNLLRDVAAARASAAGGAPAH